MDISLVLTREHRLGRFEAPNPWWDDEHDVWSVCLYRAVARDAALAPGRSPSRLDGVDGVVASTWPDRLSFHQAIGIESADGRHHLVPMAVERLCREGRLRVEDLPAVLHAWERRLRRSDFPIHLPKRLLAVLGPLCAVLAAILVVALPRYGQEVSLADAIPALFLLPLLAWLPCSTWWRTREAKLKQAIAASLPQGVSMSSGASRAGAATAPAPRLPPKSRIVRSSTSR